MFLNIQLVCILCFCISLSYCCGNNWHTFPSSVYCYKLFPKQILDFKSAQKLCQRYNATLIMIKNEKENKLITDMLFNKLKVGNDVWLDARLILGMGPKDWIWNDYNQVLYFNWAPKQPNNHNGKQYCLEMNQQYKSTKYDWDAGVWNDIACEEKRLTVCQRLSTIVDSDNDILSSNNTTIDETKTQLKSTVVLSLIPFFALIIIILAKFLWYKLNLKCFKPPKPLLGYLIMRSDYNVRINSEKPLNKKRNSLELNIN